jgi:hypothetical protein
MSGDWDPLMTNTHFMDVNGDFGYLLGFYGILLGFPDG